ncbi:fimbrial protein [Serratia inhibens]|uniref:fimbrial protein n=1 Tax=Serratia inhibens TaxID=2338073 RepID=UPI00025E399F|nr:fimbrial protein [Serratia inhibens]ANS44531.1 putative major fimbrial subunit LpfA [Serratia inhibens PRI-2C]
MLTHWQLTWRGACSLLWLSLIFTAPAVAEKCINATDCHIPVKFTGVYLENTCEISIDGGGNDNSVLLPKIATRLLQKNGDEAGSRQFQILLKACPAGKKVNLHFVSAGAAVDNNTGNLVNSPGSGMSQAVQVRLRNEAGAQIRIDDINSFQQYIIPPTGDDVMHYYMANYYANGSGRVTPGLVNTLTGIELIYN